MKNRLPLRSFVALWLAAPLVASAALNPADWRQRQDFKVDTPGLVRVTLPPATFDAAQADLRDLRLIDADGREVPFHLEIARDRPTAPAKRVAFTTQLRDETSLLTLATGSSAPLAALHLETPHPHFMKAVRIELSDDGVTWTPLDEGVPLFRQWGAEQLRVPLRGRTAAQIRLQFSDARGPALAFTGARLEFEAGEKAPLATAEAEIARQEKFSGETALTLTLPGKHLPLARLDFEMSDPLFTRRVTVAIRELRDGESSERAVAHGTIYRVQLPGAPPRESLSVSVDFVPPSSEVLVHIHDGDSPSLKVTAVRIAQRAATVAFHAETPGDYALLSGNTQTASPRYDLSSFADELRRANATTPTLQPARENPGYRPPEVLGDVALAGGPFDAKPWKHTRPVHLTADGVQELELDIAALAAARADLADLRLARDGHHVPYLLERTTLTRALPLELTPAPDPKRPHLGRWTIALPEARVPLRTLVLNSPDTLFQRSLRIFETVSTNRGDSYDRPLASTTWTRTPDSENNRALTLALETTPQTKTLTLEVDNGDNPPLRLANVQATYPVVRLIFKARTDETLTLHYGKADAAAPRYDIALVARQLLSAERHLARLDGAEPTTQSREPLLASLRGGAIFWVGLAAVVLVLLVVVAKLLPKPPAA